MRSVEMKKTGKMIRCLLVVLCVCLMTLIPETFTVFADGNVELELAFTYDQTQARTMLDMINAFRAGSDAWAWDSSNSVKTSYTGLLPLQYDGGLEKVAMQRAAEIAAWFSHTRPDGSYCFSAGGYGTAADVYGGNPGENIAYGYDRYKTASEVFEAWLETDEDYAGQGHRRNMLGNFSAVGIGYASYGDYHFWVQEFGSPAAVLAGTGQDGLQLVKMLVSDEIFSKYSLTFDDYIDEREVTFGKEEPLPVSSLTAEVMNQGTSYYMYLPVASDPLWMVSDPAICTLEGGKLIPVKAGYTTLKAVYKDQTFTFPLHVAPCPMSGAQITAPEQIYDGKPKKPPVTVIKDEVTLVPDVDYVVSYSDNTEAGSGYIEATGIGNYYGSWSGLFGIKRRTIADGTLSGLQDVTYTGSPLTTLVRITVDGTILHEGIDYTLEWVNHTEPGTAFVYAYGKGNYDGQLEGSFKIIAPPQKDSPSADTPKGDGDGTVVHDSEDNQEHTNPSQEPQTSLPVDASFTIGNGVYRVIHQDVSGQAEVAFIKPASDISNLKIPNTVQNKGIVYKVTAVGKKACSRRSSLKKVTIGNHVRIIGIQAFYGCPRLQTVTIGKKVETIGRHAFRNCEKLKSVVFKTKILKKGGIGAKALAGTNPRLVVKVPSSCRALYLTLFRAAGLSKRASVR